MHTTTITPQLALVCAGQATVALEKLEQKGQAWVYFGFFLGLVLILVFYVVLWLPCSFIDITRTAYLGRLEVRPYRKHR